MKVIVFHFRKNKHILRIPSIGSAKTSVKRYLSRYGLQVFFMALFMLGLVIGASFYRNYDKSIFDKLDLLFLSNIRSRLDMTAFEIFISCFASYFLFVFAAFLCAFSVWGFSALPIVALFRGFAVGLSSAFIFALYKMSGIGFYILVVLPGTVLFLLTMISYFTRAFGLSLRFNRLSVLGNNDTGGIKPAIRFFLKKSLMVFFYTGGCAVVDMLLWILFTDKFKF